jgi:DNA-binding CsgD family transcriptional regulator
VTALGTPTQGARPPSLTDREPEREALDRFLDDVRSGDSRAVVLLGEPGVGKTALLNYLAEGSAECRFARSAGVESEMELAFAGLHQLCGSMIGHAQSLPGPQRDALHVIFGLQEGSVPDRFLVGLAVLSLFSEVAAKRPLICIIDDQQWLDRASAQVLAFVARRLGAESIGLAFAARVLSSDLAGLPQLAVGGLPAAAARALLDSVLSGPVDARVRDQIVTETGGNPLALLELPRDMTIEELAGGFGVPHVLPLAGTIEESFRKRIEALPADTRQLLVLAAADPSGDPILVWRAAESIGIDRAAAAPTSGIDLIDFGARVNFRHPLVRSAAYWSASPEERREIHRALAVATNVEVDADRRAWHRAHAAEGPDESVARELESSANRAQVRGGLAAAAAFLEQSALLTPGQRQRAGRALDAAQAKVRAGIFDAAFDLLVKAEAGPLSKLQHARLDLVRAQLCFARNRSSEAPYLLLTAAKQLEPVDLNLARITLRDAFTAALFAGRLAELNADLRAVARAVATAPLPRNPPDTVQVLLDGMAACLNRGFDTGAPIVRGALNAFGVGHDIPADQRTSWMGLAYIAAMHVRDFENGIAIAAERVRLTREMGMLSELPLALSAQAFLMIHAGDLAEAAVLVDEVQVAQVDPTASNLAPYSALGVAAMRGDEEQAAETITTMLRDTVPRGEGFALAICDWARAVMGNASGRYEEALVAARRASENDWELAFANWALAERVEAAERSGDHQDAIGAYHRLARLTLPSGTDWALGVESRAHALVSHNGESESFFKASIGYLDRAGVRGELARTQLVFGEWLRRRARRADARQQLRAALDSFESLGMEGFARRSRRELSAAGEATRQRRVHTTARLTPQEAQIARLARDGLSNPEIGTRLFISARTVQYHLSKVFTKLNVTSRSQLYRVLNDNTGQPEI